MIICKCNRQKVGKVMARCDECWRPLCGNCGTIYDGKPFCRTKRTRCIPIRQAAELAEAYKELEASGYYLPL